MTSSKSPVFTLQLPYPDPILSPNSPKRHWKAKLPAKQDARQYAEFASCQHKGIFKKVKNLQMTLIIFPPDHKHRDLDNVFAALKSSIDGMCKGINIDDSQIRQVTLKWGDVVKDGLVEFELRKSGRILKQVVSKCSVCHGVHINDGFTCRDCGNFIPRE